MKKQNNILDLLNKHFSQAEIKGIDDSEDQKISPEPDDGIPEDLDDESDDASIAGQDDESYKDQFLGMSISSLRNIVDNASRILSNLEKTTVKENLTASWLQGMIAVVENNMSSVHDFVMFSDHDDDNSSYGSKERPGLWENIRKKKEKKGKKYRPARVGDKDRPDPKTWKELTE